MHGSCLNGVSVGPHAVSIQSELDILVASYTLTSQSRFRLDMHNTSILPLCMLIATNTCHLVPHLLICGHKLKMLHAELVEC